MSDGQIKIRAKVEGLEEAANQINDFSKRSQMALTSLNQVVQDLPFGFIGIQNNLPVLTQQFGNLIKESGGVLNAFKSLGATLLGPTGIVFAVSAVTSGVTFLIQKYGSLGDAIDAIFGKVSTLSKVTRDAAKSQEEFNESFKTNGQIIAEASGSVDAQITKIQLLSNVVTDLNKSETLRKNALSELQKINKAYFGDITTGTEDINKLISATNKYTEALLKNAIAESYKSQLTQASINLQNQKDLLNELNNSANELTKKTGRDIVLFTGGQIVKETKLESAKLTGQIESQTKVVNEASNSVNKLKESFKNATLDALNFVEPIDKGSQKVKDYKYQIDELIGALSFKTEIQNIKELADVILDVNKKYGERKTSLSELQNFGDGFFQNLSIEKSSYLDLKDAIDTYIQKLQVLDLEIKGRIAAAKLQEQADKNAAAAAVERARADEELLNQLIKSSMSNEKFPNQAQDIGLLNLEIALSNLKNIEIAYAQSYQALNDVFFNPLQESLNTLLTTGKLTFQEFANSVVASITRIMTKLITTKIIQLLTNLLVPGAGLIASAGLSTVGTSALGEFLSNTGGTANFGGIQGGGLGMSGQVNVVLRGSDLIGAINRTNSQIKRVG
jgi:hypothetical protein